MSKVTINIQQEIENNKVLNEVKALLVSQTEKGIVKYGKTVTTNALSVEEWLRHVQEEMTDALVYSTVIRQIVCESNATNEKLIAENKKLRSVLSKIAENECYDGMNRYYYQDLSAEIISVARKALEESK